MGYDIAPAFRRLIKVLPLDALEVMKEHLEASKDRAILLAVAEIQQEINRRVIVC